MSAAEVTSYDSRRSATEEWSAFRRLGGARLCPVSTQLGSARCSSPDDVHHTVVQLRQHHNQLLHKTTDSEEANEDSGMFDSASTYAAASNRNHAAASNLDRIANVSVHFPCPAAAEELARKLRTARRNNRRIATTNAISLTSRRSSLDSDTQVTSFDVLPDGVVTRVFACGLDSYHLCRCALVCRRWNDLVWNNSSLWTTIDFSCHETLDVDSALRTVTRALSRWTPRLCLGVEVVVLRDCRRLTDDGLRTVARRCVDLRHLDASSCISITNNAVFDVMSRCVNLQHLDINGIRLSVLYV